MSMTTNIRQTSVEHNIAIVLKRQSSVEAHTSFGTKRKLVMSKSANEMTSENVTMKRHNVKRQNSTGSISSVTTRKHDSVETPTTSMASVRRKDSYTVRTDRRNPDILTCRVCQFQMTINSQRLFEIQERLEKLLTEKKVLNSKIVAESFRNFQAQVIKIRNRQPADIKPAIRRLESSLKSEGAYKNVKSGFEGIKLEITEVVDRSEYVTDKPSTILTSPTKVPVKSRDSSQTNSPQASKKPIPRATTVTLSQQKDRGKRHAMPSIQRPVIKEEASSLSPRTTQTKTPALETKDKDGRVVNHQDILSLNKTISKLFSHLAIDKPGVTDPAAAKGQQPPKTQQKTTSSSQAISVAGKVQKGSSKRDVDDIQELINKLKLFEHELQRKRTVEHDEIQTLQSELQKLKSQLKDQHGQLQRIRGTHMIANKAKGKHVELLEERHMTEKKDIEEKLQALEKNIKRNLEVTRENDQIEETKQELYKLKLEIEKLHRLADPTVTAHDEFASRKGRTRLRISDDDPSYEIGEMLHKMAVIRNEMQGLRDSKAALQRHVKELDGWESRFGDIEKELETFHHDALSDLSAMERESDLTGGNDGIRRQLAQEPSSTSPPSKTKLKKLHTLYLNKRRKLEDTEKSLRQSHQELDLTKARLLKLIDSVDRVYSDSSAFPDTSFSPRDRGRGGMELSSLSDKSEQDDESKLFDIAMVRVNDFAVRTKKYESLLQQNGKGMKDYENDLKVFQRHVDRLHEGVASTWSISLSDPDTLEFADVNTVSESNRGVVRKIIRVDKGLRFALDEHNKLRTQLKEFQKSDKVLTDVVMETEELCRYLQVAVKDSDEAGVKVKSNLTECRIALRKLKDQDSERLSALNDLEKHASSSQSDAKDQMMKLNMQITVREQELKDQHSEVKRLRDEADHDKTEISRLQLEVNDRFKSTLSVADEEKVYLRNKIDDVQRRLDIAEKNLNEAMKEKYNLLTRLSVMAGARLTDDNPAILDLSDPFRPTKLAEMFSGLYDDEWTNAYETLINQFSLEETEAIQQLLSVVMRSFTFCDVTAWSQMTDLHRVLFMLHQSESSPAKLEEKTQLLSAEDRKQIRDIRKWCAPQAADTVVQLFINGDTDTKWTKQQVDACEPYINKCVTLSWLMNVQSPPVHMANEVESGDPFDGNKHKHYTNTGTVVDFVVWPTLHLTKQGAVLSKGVVQTRRQQE
ncbi:golgin IMH1-like isoform X2 [Pecten maximus]|uniref:golgin IMH1-like isoform X2 n=1 Tax=Pecten maximus TaxID=6579 RepID=UPI0014588B1F|nr:golgin IMH1-like isoform X2 [Pecten maximus]